jgi:polysaccharide export outer membrane protein
MTQGSSMRTGLTRHCEVDEALDSGPGRGLPGQGNCKLAGKMRYLASEMASVAPTGSRLALLLFPLLVGCGGNPQGREGSLDELIAGQSAGSSPLADRGLDVEVVATALPPQVDEYRIGPNDVLNIVVLEHEEFSSPRDFNRGVIGTVVKKDGNIHVPIIGPVPAAGHTVEEFQEILRGRLAEFVKEPYLSVDVLKYESQKFYVLGEVNKPGAFPVNGAVTLLEGIGLAGGVKLEGNLERAYVVRDGALLPINLASLLLRGDTSRNIYMRHRDLIYIPSAGDQTVYVLGEVPRPGAIQIGQAGLSLAQALAEAGGLRMVEARQRSIKVIRGSWQEPTIYTLSYDTLLEQGDRIRLAPGDRVVVAPTALTTLSRYMQQILPFLQGADYALRIYGQAAAAP